MADTLQQWIIRYISNPSKVHEDIVKIEIDCAEANIEPGNLISFLKFISKCPNLEKIAFVNRIINTEDKWDQFISNLMEWFAILLTEDHPKTKNIPAQALISLRTILTTKLKQINLGDAVFGKAKLPDHLLTFLEKLPPSSPLKIVTPDGPSSTDTSVSPVIKKRFLHLVGSSAIPSLSYLRSKPTPLQASRRYILSGIGRLIDGLFGAAVGLALTIIMLPIICNPITYLLALLNIAPVIDENVSFTDYLKVTLRKMFFPFVALWFGFSHGFNSGFINAFKMPRDLWLYANEKCNITTSNILTSWIIVAFASLALGVLFALVALGIIAMPAFIPIIFAAVMSGFLFAGKGLIGLAITPLVFSFLYQICYNVPILNRFFDKLAGMIIGPLLGIVSALFIHNPITCFIGALDITYWKIYPVPLNLLRILISPIAFPLMALLDHIKDGIKVGYKHGTLEALKVPVKAWNSAPYYASEILLPWVTAGFLVSGGVGLIYGGVIAFSTAVNAALTYLTFETLMFTGVGVFVSAVVYELVQAFREIYDIESKAASQTHLAEPAIAQENKVLTEPDSCMYKDRRFTFKSYYSHSENDAIDNEDSTTTFGRFFSLPKDLSRSSLMQNDSHQLFHPIRL